MANALGAAFTYRAALADLVLWTDPVLRAQFEHLILDTEAMAKRLQSSAPLSDDTVLSSPPPHLTARQWEIAALIAKGSTNAAIAERLVIEPGTVANHVSAILQRVGAWSRAGIAVWFVQQGRDQT